MTYDEYLEEAGYGGEIREIWSAAQKAERERIKQIVDEVGWKVKHDAWLDCLDVIMERIEG